jgi:hypothetical protein
VVGTGQGIGLSESYVTYKGDAVGRFTTGVFRLIWPPVIFVPMWAKWFDAMKAGFPDAVKTP